jgi:lysophospholipase L1-like esterase
LTDYQPSNQANIISQGTEIKEGDTNTQFQIQLLDVSGQPVDLTGSTVSIYFSNQSNSVLLLNKQASLSSTPTDGKIIFQFSENDATGNGIINIQVNVTYSDGDIEKFPANGYASINITPSLDNLENVQLSTYTLQQVVDQLNTSFSTSLNNIKTELQSDLNTHETDHTNPHQVTAAQVGLGNVNNTADIDKPISTAQQESINAVDNKIGDLSQLPTNDKSSLVNSNKEIAAQLADIPNQPYNLKGTLYNRAIKSIESGINANQQLHAAASACQSGVLKIAAIGDSILEGFDQTNPLDAYFERVMRTIKTMYPSVSVEYTNFGLGGRALSQAVDPSYHDYSGGNRIWVTDYNKAWRDYVKDYQADLVIISFGMNDANGEEQNKYESDKTFADNLTNLIDYISSGNTKPSIALTTTHLCTTDITGVQSEYPGFAQSQIVTQAIARATRYYAKNNNCTLADSNRLYLLLRDGTDDVLRSSNLEANLSGYYTDDWSGDKNNFILSGTNLTAQGGLNKFISRQRLFYEGAIEFDFAPSDFGTSGVLEVDVRVSSSLGQLIYNIVPSSVQNYADGQCVLYKKTPQGLSALTSVNGLIINKNTSYHIRFESNGDRHRVFLNGVLIIDTSTYYCLHDGYISIGSAGLSPNIANLLLEFNDPIKDYPMYTQEQLIGTLPASDTNTSGNGINHPTGFGHAMFYLPAFYGLIQAIGDRVTPYYCSLVSTISQTVGQSEAQVSFNPVAEWDKWAMRNGNSIVVPCTGNYLISAYVGFNASSDPSNDACFIHLLTSKTNTFSSFKPINASNGSDLNITHSILLEKGDSIFLYANKLISGAIIQARLSIAQIN